MKPLSRTVTENNSLRLKKHGGKVKQLALRYLLYFLKKYTEHKKQ